MEKLPGQKDIYSKIYFEQILKPIIFPLFKIFDSDYIYIENGSKVYKRKAQHLCLEYGIYGFNWPPSLSDLNFIKKI
jgi:hypothetical protein